eukprot:161713-Prymnesium_polylepis.1
MRKKVPSTGHPHIGGGRIRSGSVLVIPDEPGRLVLADAGDGHAVVFHPKGTGGMNRGKWV